MQKQALSNKEHQILQITKAPLVDARGGGEGLYASVGRAHVSAHALIKPTKPVSGCDACVVISGPGQGRDSRRQGSP